MCSSCINFFVIMYNFFCFFRPVVFTVCNESIYEANFVVSSLSSGADSQNSQKSYLSVNSNILKKTQPQLVKEQQQIASKLNEASVIPNSSRNSFRENISIPNKLSNNYVNSDSRKRRRDSDLLDCNVPPKHIMCVDNNNRDSDSRLSVPCNSTQDTMIIPNDEMDLNESIPGSPTNLPNNNLNNLFGRCFNSTFQRNTLPGFNKVIVYDSDGLEDSD